MAVVPSLCRICAVKCPILVEVEDGEVKSVRGDRDNTFSHGFACVKGRAQPALLRNPKRLLRPLKREADGQFREISSAQAMDEIAARLKALLDRHGQRSIATYWGTMITANNTAEPFISAFGDALGLTMRFNPTTIDKPGKNIARALHGYWMAPRQAFDEPDVALLIGINPLVTFQGMPMGNPGRWLNEQLERGMQLIVIDPRRTDVARRATLFLQAKPGEDSMILAAMLRVIVEEALYDKAFVAENVAGLDALRAALDGFTPGEAARRAGVPADDIVKAARIFAGAKRGYATPGVGASMSGPGTLLEYLVLNLETLCGHWLRAGERVRNPGVLLPLATPRAQAKPPTPGYGYGQRMRVRGLGETAAGMPVVALPDEMLLEGEGQVRALISMGGNPVNAWPDEQRTIQALSGLELLVQIDPWMSQTSRLAHYVIAPKMSLETSGCTIGQDFSTSGAPAYGSHEPYAQYSQAVARPPPGADLLEEWEFFYGLAQRMEVPLTIGKYMGGAFPPMPIDMKEKPTTDQLFELFCQRSRVPLDEVKKYPRGRIFHEPAVHVLPKEPGWEGRFEVANVDMMADLAAEAARGEAVDPRYPFRLLCRRIMQMYNSSVNDPSTTGGRAYNPAYLNPADLRKLALAEGEQVRIRSPHGEIIAIAHGDAALRPGLVSLSHGFGDMPDLEDPLRTGTNVNRLLSADDPAEKYCGMPKMSNIPVALSRA